jgi:hypothetical protein
MPPSERSPETGLVESCLLSCAAAEALLRGMLERPWLPAHDMLSAHLDDCLAADEKLSESALDHPSVSHITRAVRALHAAARLFDCYRYSTDPEHHHMPILRANALELVAEGKREREAAAITAGVRTFD